MLISAKLCLCNLSFLVLFDKNLFEPLTLCGLERDLISGGEGVLIGKDLLGSLGGLAITLMF